MQSTLPYLALQTQATPSQGCQHYRCRPPRQVRRRQLHQKRRRRRRRRLIHMIHGASLQIYPNAAADAGYARPDRGPTGRVFEEGGLLARLWFDTGASRASKALAVSWSL
jgi:hypothetical protein